MTVVDKIAEALAEGAAWEFYDDWAAFPFNRDRNTDRHIIGEFGVGLNHPHGGTSGEWRIRFYEFHRNEHWRKPQVAARLEAFGDSWAALHASGLIEALAALDGQPQGPDEVRAVLVAAGFTDTTVKLRGTHPSYCSHCKGTGYLDDIRPDGAP